MSNGKTHLARAVHWSKDIEVELVEVFASGIGMTVPIVIAAAMRQLPFGLTASVGSLAVAGVGFGSSTKMQVQGLASAFSVAVAASSAAVLVAGNGWFTDVLVVLLACVAATIGGYSRPMVVATMRFILFLTIFSNVIQATSNPARFLFLIVAGALGTSFVTVLIGVGWRVYRPIKLNDKCGPVSSATAAQKFTRWKRTLRNLSGWQYPFRLGLCLSVAGFLQWRWPDHHIYWTSVTVAILTQRRVQTISIRTTQRALGTALGVIAASLLLAFQLPIWGLILVIGLLAGARPFLKFRNYLAYSACMIPLILLVMDVGQPLGSGILVDRLVATVLGVALVVAASLSFRSIVA